MHVLTVLDFKQLLQQWCELNNDQFNLYWPLIGGWEPWVQASYAAFVIHAYPTTNILREQHIYQNTFQRVAWLANDTAMEITHTIAAEIKCQSTENRNNFTAALDNDLSKMDETNIAPKYKGCVRICAGIAFENRARQWMLDHGFTPVSETKEISCQIYIFPPASPMPYDPNNT